MKKYNKNILVFVFCMLFVGAGLCSGDLYKGFVESFQNAMEGSSSRFTKISNLERKIDNVSSEYLLYHNLMMDANSIKENLLGTRIIKKVDSVTVKSDSESLYQTYEEFSDEQIQSTVGRVKELYQECKNNAADFLYVLAPRKGDYYSTPLNVNNNSKDNYLHYISEMDRQGIPLLDFETVFNNKSAEELFYYTDHHWTTRIGFEASGEICRELHTRYAFSYDEEKCDITNYRINLYDDYFLGTYGKKTGSYFSSRGADDFELITPLFETSFTERQPYKNEKKEGDFCEAMLVMNNLEEKDYYATSGKQPYYTYLGGDLRLQIIVNHLSNNGKKALIIRDSFGIPVVPFLALNMLETHIVDIRDGDKYIGDKVHVYEYIKTFKPDYVLVLYTGADIIDSGNGRFDFKY